MYHEHTPNESGYHSFFKGKKKKNFQFYGQRNPDYYIQLSSH